MKNKLLFIYQMFNLNKFLNNIILIFDKIIIKLP